VLTAKSVIASRTRLLQFSLAYSLHLSLVFESSQQAVGMATFSNAEYADIHYIYGYCDSNARAAVEEYQRRFPDRRAAVRRLFSNVHRHLKRK
jgi:hypothetical protein